jgi:hypothetical protein
MEKGKSKENVEKITYSTVRLCSCGGMMDAEMETERRR